MSFRSLPFLFLCLPAGWLVYFLVPRKARPYVLLLTSLAFCAFSGLKYLVVILCLTLFTYGTGLVLLQEQSEKRRKREFVFGVLVLLLVLCYDKASRQGALLGVSFFVFSAISYLADVFRRPEEGSHRLLPVAIYLTFFPKIASGPLVRFGSMKKEIDRASVSSAQAADGVERLLNGLFKKVLIADTLSRAFSSFSGLSTTGASWLALLCYGLYLYFDFGGYSDMAIGISRLFGFRSQENFRYPYGAGGFSDFWRRWHITLGAWFRDYVYIPLGGNRAGDTVTALNLMSVWVLTGLWHGLTWNFLLWGLFSGLFVLADHFIFYRSARKLPLVPRVLLTDLVIFLGWTFFFTDTPGQAGAFLLRLLGRGAAGAGQAGSTAFYLREYGLWILLGLVCASPLPAFLRRKILSREGWTGRVIMMVLYAALLALSVAEMVQNTYTPFLYFQF